MKLDLKNFKTYHKEFSLGHLTTESVHPDSKNLSHIVSTDIIKAIDIIKTIDEKALQSLESRVDQIFQFQNICQKVLKNNGRVFIVGCGATGRLALTIEKIAIDLGLKDKVIGFMAGGDYALVRAVERFEDSIEFGQKQLMELGFNQNDLCVAVTEGGETSFVIGAVMKAAEISKYSSYFLYCNPDEQLLHLSRSKFILENDKIKKLNLTCGPMAISGSTRMQATTVQMLVVGIGLFYTHKSASDLWNLLQKMTNIFTHTDFHPLAPFINHEFKMYAEGGLTNYITSEQLAISILTDTTERSPTFSLPMFEKVDEDYFCFCYLILEDEEDTQKAWTKLLGRAPRCLDWGDETKLINFQELLKVDISKNSMKRRSLKNEATSFFIRPTSDFSQIVFSFGDNDWKINVTELDLFGKHLLLKQILNIHSTLIMGLLKRYDGNLMSYVRPSNFKLIDRAVRYIEILTEKNDKQYSREKIIETLFKLLSLNPKDNSSIVYRVIDELQKDQ